MNYSAARADVEDGEVLLFERRGPVAAVIRWATRSRYSHAGLAVWVRGRLMVAEARELRGCRLVPLSSAVRGASVARFRVVPWVPLDVEKALDAALKRLGQPYGWTHLLRIAASKVPVSLLRKIPVAGRLAPRRAWSEDDQAKSGPSMICSEFVSHCLRVGGMDLVLRLSDRDTTPGDLARSAALAFIDRFEGE